MKYLPLVPAFFIGCGFGTLCFLNDSVLRNIIDFVRRQRSLGSRAQAVIVVGAALVLTVVDLFF
jgi:hypothetical protein